MNAAENSSEIKFVSFINKAFLLVHVFLILLYAVIGADIMSMLNIISICFYCVMAGPISKGVLKVYIYLMAAEVLSHMVLATICLGLACNFWICLIGMIFLFFIEQYILKKQGGTPPIVISIVYSIVVILMQIFAGHFIPIYQLSKMQERLISIGVLTFVLVALVASMIYFTLFMENEEGEMTKQAQFDQLTDLPNRVFMKNEIDKVFNSGMQDQYYLALIDIDDFKKINDTYGHNIGDNALKILAHTLVEFARGSELKYCRWGGEEFLLLGICENGQIPSDYLDALRKEIHSKTIWTDKSSTRMTVTIGAGKYTNGWSSKEWVNFADKQLYVGKCTGKNKVVC